MRTVFRYRRPWYEACESRLCLSHVAFSIENVACCADRGGRDISVADVDGDGDPDLVYAAWYDDVKIAWYENLDGQGDFAAEREVTRERMSLTDIATADVDGDGDTDVIAAGEGLFWYENLDGKGGFGARQIITNAYRATFVTTVDTDMDGDLDLFVASNRGAIWHENVDGPGFGPGHLIGERVEVSSLATADLDGDGDADVVFGTRHRDGYSLTWHQNTGDPSGFGVGQVIGHSLTRAIVATDFDNDGDADVIAAYGGTVRSFENDGRGGFSFPEHVADSFPSRIDAADLDGDGDEDLIAADGQIVWTLENQDGMGTFGAAQSIGEERFNSIGDVAVDDLDADGHRDVVFASWRGLWWSANGGSGNFGPLQRLTPNTHGSGPIAVGDLDGDLDADIIHSSYRGLVWYENSNGQGTFVERQAISNERGTVTLSDVDGDGDLDMLRQNSDGTLWFENDGQGSFLEEHFIGLFTYPFVMADLDGDGDEDIVSWEIAWYENLDGRGTFGPARGVFTEWPAYGIAVGDLDNNGSLDIAFAANHGIAWVDNIDGLGHFGPQRRISAPPEEDEFFGTRGAAIADLNGDGNLDVLFGSGRESEFFSGVNWYLGQGDGTFGELTNGMVAGHDFIVADVDGDGDSDIVSAYYGVYTDSNMVAWYENTEGQGVFGPRRVITTLANAPSYIAVADVDGDQALDVLSSSYHDGRLAWYKQRVVGDANGDGVFNSSDLVRVFQAGQYEDGIFHNSDFSRGDWNGDGEFDSEDLVFAFQAGTYAAAQVATQSELAAAIDWLLDLDDDRDWRR